MIGAGALEIDSGIAIDEGFFADDHGVNQRGLRRRPERMDFGNDAGVNAGAPEFDAAAREAGEELYVFGFRGTQGRDAVGGEVSLIVEGTGIAEVAGQFQFEGKADALAIMEEAHGGRRMVFVDPEAHAGMHGNSRAVFCDDLFGFDVEGLSDFVCRCFAQPTFAGYVCGHFDWLVVREG